MAGRELPDDWPAVKTTPQDADLMVNVDHRVAYSRHQITQSRAVVASIDLGQRCARADIFDCNLRFVMLHMIDEIARHAGHADIIRESLDGSRG